jgi:hypothetical protein
MPITVMINNPNNIVTINIGSHRILTCACARFGSVSMVFADSLRAKNQPATPPDIMAGIANSKSAEVSCRFVLRAGLPNASDMA